MKTKYIFFILFLSINFNLFSETPRWLRNVSISPSGDKIAFTYKGDIYTVDSDGGLARRLTNGPAYDSKPVWNFDGTKIAFLSSREGSDDIYIMASNGGTPRRLTFQSEDELPLTFLNDSVLLFSGSGIPGRNSSRAPYFSQLYTINVDSDSPRPVLYSSMPVVRANANSEGNLLLEERRGIENIYRKHEKSSANTRLWLLNNGEYQNLIEGEGQNQNPVWGNNEKIYYLADKDGSLNVYQKDSKGDNDIQLTHFEHHPVRHLSASKNDLLAFSWDGDIYTLKPGETPQKIDINIQEDLYENDHVKSYEHSDAENFSLSPDATQISFTIRGDLYVTDSKYKTTKRITNTAGQERNSSFSPDGRKLVYDSDEGGFWKLYVASISNEDEKSFAYSTDLDITPLYECGTSAMQPVFSPDGKKVAFLENRETIKVIDIDTKKVTTVFDKQHNFSYTDGDIPILWSPDSKWIMSTTIEGGGWQNKDIAIAKVDGSEVIDLTQSGYNDYNPKWVLNGKGITYSSGRYGMKAHGSWGNQDDVILMVLDDEAWENFNLTKEEIEKEEEMKSRKEKSSENKAEKNKKPKKKNEKVSPADKSELNFENRHYHTIRLTDRSSNITDYYLSKDGDKLYYVARATEGGTNLFVKDLKGYDTKVLAYDVSGKIFPDKDENNLFLADDYNSIKKVDTQDGRAKDIRYEAIYDRKPSAEREYMYDHITRTMEEKFYDEKMNGVDWHFYTGHYRDFLPYINNNRDFAELMSEVLGELNASHTGAYYYGDGPKLYTSFLGAYFDNQYLGDGLKIAEIMPRGPLSLKSKDIVAGDIITSIDDNKIEAGKDYSRWLEGKAGKKVRLGIRKKDGTEKFVTVKPISIDSQIELAYQRWIERNEKLTDSLSNGRLGYVHVKDMNRTSFQNTYSRLLGKNRNKEAVVIDTRHNGGGWLHNDLALLLNGKEYITFEPRGKYIGHEPFSQWTKPSIMLVNEANYSDAHGTPYIYQKLGIGELVGTPVAGTMTSVWWETQIDPEITFGIPQIPNITTDRVTLENTELIPDIIIYNLPSDSENGRDAQLEGAVTRLLEILDSKK